jgi:hypothetical protein
MPKRVPAARPPMRPAAKWSPAAATFGAMQESATASAPLVIVTRFMSPLQVTRNIHIKLLIESCGFAARKRRSREYTCPYSWVFTAAQHPDHARGFAAPAGVIAKPMRPELHRTKEAEPDQPCETPPHSKDCSMLFSSSPLSRTTKAIACPSFNVGVTLTARKP